MVGGEEEISITKMTPKAGIKMVFLLLVASETKGLQITKIILSPKSQGNNMINSKIRL
jgi:hypothetical protein